MKATPLLMILMLAIAGTAFASFNSKLLSPGDCAKGKAESGDTVQVHYRGTLTDGTKFDASYDRGDPFKFRLGQGQVIKCWEKGIEGLCIGEKRVLTCPPDMAYGERGAGGIIPPHATLNFDVELVAISNKM